MKRTTKLDQVRDNLALVPVDRLLTPSASAAWADREVSGFCAAMTFIPTTCSSGMTFAHEEPAA